MGELGENLDEFTSRFDLRHSAPRGKFFCCLGQQAVHVKTAHSVPPDRATGAVARAAEPVNHR